MTTFILFLLSALRGERVSPIQFDPQRTHEVRLFRSKKWVQVVPPACIKVFNVGFKENIYDETVVCRERSEFHKPANSRRYVKHR
jgi:hypothetical protein